MHKRVFFGILVLLLLTDMTNYVFLVPILPVFLLAKGVSLTLIGFILSFYQIGNFIAAVYLGKNLIYFSKKKIMLIGHITLIASNLAFGFLNYSSSTTFIVVFCIILRLIQGSAIAIATSPIYAYVPVLYPYDLDKKYAIIEISQGIGLALGPVIAGLLYEYLEYTWSFQVMTIFYSITSTVCFPFILSYQLKTREEESLKNSSGEEDKIEKTPQIKLKKILKSRNLMLTMFVFISSLMSYSIIQPGFSDHVMSYGGSEDDVGLIFGLGDLTYALTGVFVMNLISRYQIKRKYLMIFGGVMSMISLLLVGPEHYIFIPDDITVLAVAMVVLGFSQMFYVPILIPEFIEILRDIDPNAEGNEEMAASLYIVSLSICVFIGQFFGGFLVDYCGFNRGMTIYAMILLCFLIIYAFFRKYKQIINPKDILKDAEIVMVDDDKGDKNLNEPLIDNNLSNEIAANS